MFKQVSDILLINGLIVAVLDEASPIAVPQHLVQQRDGREERIQLAAGISGLEEGDDIGELSALKKDRLMASKQSKQELIEEDPGTPEEGIEVVGLEVTRSVPYLEWARDWRIE